MLTRPAFRRPVPLILPRDRLVLVTNAKCGGTSLKRWFLTRAIQHPGADASSALRLARETSPRFAAAFHLQGGRALFARLDEDKPMRRLNSLYAATVSKPWLSRSIARGFPAVWVMRDPVRRLVSAFLDKFCGGDRTAEYVRKVVDVAGTGEAVSFAQFVAWLEQADLDRVNHHWRPQIFVGGQFPWAEIVRLEHLTADLARVAHPVLRGAAAEIGTSNSRATTAEHRVPLPGAGTLPNTAITAFRAEHGVYPHADDMLTGDLRARIAVLYSEDYDALARCQSVSEASN